MKTSGVKKQLLVAVYQNLSENYENVKPLLELIDAKNVQYVLSCDMKMANILSGIQSHSSAHPCCWCNIDSKSLNKTGQPRTFERLNKDYEAFVETGANYMKAKEFKNVNYQSLISSDSEKSFILNLIPPMKLQLMIGVVNHLINKSYD